MFDATIAEWISIKSGLRLFSFAMVSSRENGKFDAWHSWACSVLYRADRRRFRSISHRAPARPSCLAGELELARRA